jgi:hypothetical protein
MTVAEEDATRVRIFSQGGLAVGIGHRIAKKFWDSKNPLSHKTTGGFKSLGQRLVKN